MQEVQRHRFRGTAHARQMGNEELTRELFHQIPRFDGGIDRNLTDLGIVVTYRIYGLVTCFSEPGRNLIRQSNVALAMSNSRFNVHTGAILQALILASSGYFRCCARVYCEPGLLKGCK